MNEKALGWIILLIVFAVLGYLAYKYVFSPEKLSQKSSIISGTIDSLDENSSQVSKKFSDMSPRTKVVVCLEDNSFHIPKCPAIKGSTEKMFYSVALQKNYIQCEKCIVEDEIESRSSTYKDHYR
ncbi:hypothetical protein H8D57_02430 [bacterium]|nr:hypothetical protein [bacterium]